MGGEIQCTEYELNEKKAVHVLGLLSAPVASVVLESSLFTL